MTNLALCNKMIAQQEENELNLSHQYSHVLRFFNVYHVGDIVKVGQCLGYHVFLANDHVLNLNRIYQSKMFGLVCRLCDDIKIQGLVLSFNEVPSLLKDLTLTNFSRLRTLDISMCGLQSIELLSKLNFKQLNFLNLSGNKISNLRTLSRLVLPSNCSIDLTHNKYCEIPNSFPTSEIQLDGKVIDKAKAWRVIASLKKNSNRLLSKYFGS